MSVSVTANIWATSEAVYVDCYFLVYQYSCFFFFIYHNFFLIFFDIVANLDPDPKGGGCWWFLICLVTYSDGFCGISFLCWLKKFF